MSAMKKKHCKKSRLCSKDSDCSSEWAKLGSWSAVNLLELECDIGEDPDQVCKERITSRRMTKRKGSKKCQVTQEVKVKVWKISKDDSQDQTLTFALLDLDDTCDTPSTTKSKRTIRSHLDLDLTSNETTSITNDENLKIEHEKLRTSICPSDSMEQVASCCQQYTSDEDIEYCSVDDMAGNNPGSNPEVRETVVESMHKISEVPKRVDGTKIRETASKLLRKLSSRMLNVAEKVDDSHPPHKARKTTARLFRKASEKLFKLARKVSKSSHGTATEKFSQLGKTIKDVGVTPAKDRLCKMGKTVHKMARDAAKSSTELASKVADPVKKAGRRLVAETPSGTAYEIISLSSKDGDETEVRTIRVGPKEPLFVVKDGEGSRLYTASDFRAQTSGQRFRHHTKAVMRDLLAKTSRRLKNALHVNKRHPNHLRTTYNAANGPNVRLRVNVKPKDGVATTPGQA